MVNANRNMFRIKFLSAGKEINLPSINLPNPYKYGNIIFKLVSTCRDSSYTDYGNKDKIIMFKCKRHRQLLSIKNFETCKYGVIRTQLEEIDNLFISK